MKRVDGLDRLFVPSSLAMVGASKNVEKSGGLFLKDLIASGFKGKLYPVNPRESEILGLRCYASIADIPGEVDLAIITVPAGLVPQVIAECNQKGVRYAVVHSAGFSELGAEGLKLEKEMVQSARQGDIRIIGPNCMGIFSPQAGINTIAPRVTFTKEMGPVGFVGQSGWVVENVIEIGYERGLRFSKAVSIGNQSDLTSEDLLEYLANDDDTKVIGFYIEGIKRGREFFQLARQVSKKKPVVVWKSGSSEVGVRAAASHTGSLAGNSVVFDAAMKQSGINIARNLDELIDLLVGFTCPVLPASRRVGLLVESGGGAVAGADAAEEMGLEVPTLSAEIQEELIDRLEGTIPPFSRPRNPVDLVWVTNADEADAYVECARIMLKEVDALVVVVYAELNGHFATELANLQNRVGRPIFFVPARVGRQGTRMSLLTRSGIPTFTIPERAIKALSTVVAYSEYRAQA